VPLLKVQQVADRLGVSVSLVYQLCADGLLTHFRLGGKEKRGRVMVEESDLAAFMEQCRREATASAPVLSLKHINLG
jgi:excisionase family DNA binding protein